jgi:hypothetical protein
LTIARDVLAERQIATGARRSDWKNFARWRAFKEPPRLAHDPRDGEIGDAEPSITAKMGDARMGILGGAEGNRTPDLLIANEALYHLSYGPKERREYGP